MTSSMHCWKVIFSLKPDGSPEIYDFLFKYLPKILQSLQIAEVDFKLERLEPLDDIYASLNLNEAKIAKVFTDFCRNHGMYKEKSLFATKQKTAIHARIPVRTLARVLEDYNVLFDIFWSYLIVKCSAITIDMTSASSNQLLVFGSKETLDKFQFSLSKLVQQKVSFEPANSVTYP